MDDVAIWNEALTANEIAALYNYGIPLSANSNSGNYSSSSNLAGYWRHNENSGSITYDLSGNGNHGTINGATSSTPGASNIPVLSVTSSLNNATYKIGDVIPVNITFGAAVTVSGTPQLTLETGTSDAVVNYASGSGGTTLTFNYTVASGHTSSDLDYVGTSSLALNSGTINDAAGNAATLTLASPGASGSLGANKALVIDGVVPTVANVTSTTSDGTLKVGDVAAITVTFSEAVTVTRNPTINFRDRNIRRCGELFQR